METDFVDGKSSRSELIHDHFSTHGETPSRQLLAWRDQLGYLLDVPISRAQLADGFRGTIDSYRVKDLRFLDSRTDPFVQARSVSRISKDNVRKYVFHVVVEGSVETLTGLYPQRKAMQSVPGILALDLNQPMRMERPACRVQAFFLPRELVEAILPEAESIHGRVVEYTSPIARLIPAHLAALNRLNTMSACEAHSAISTCAQLIVLAFGKQARLSGNARQTASAVMFGMVRRYIQENLHQPDLSPESVLQMSNLSRATLYRFFENEGGLSTYIRNRRLREAADELVRFPHIAVVEIAYGLGFKSASDFNHAFRRAYDMAPRDFRGQQRRPNDGRRADSGEPL
jgi:AraC-like DNA-binding protein